MGRWVASMAVGEQTRDSGQRSPEGESAGRVSGRRVGRGRWAKEREPGQRYKGLKEWTRERAKQGL